MSCIEFERPSRLKLKFPVHVKPFSAERDNSIHRAGSVFLAGVGLQSLIAHSRLDRAQKRLP